MLLPPYELHERVRLIRYFSGLNQWEMARILGMTQAWLSKLEAGQLTLTARQVYLIREHFKVSAESILDGAIGYRDLNQRFGARLALSGRYGKDPALRCRILYGFVRLYEQELGREKVEDLFRSLHVRPEILADPDFEIGAALLAQIIRFGVSRKILGSAESWNVVAECLISPVALGLGSSRLANSRSPSDALKKFCEMMPQFSESLEPKVRIVNSRRVEITVRPEQTLVPRKLAGDQDYLDALAALGKAVFRSVAGLHRPREISVTAQKLPEKAPVVMYEARWA